jgi:hemolysin activation/secretion protein
LEELKAVAQAITRWYRSRGFVTSRAFIPAQTVEGGRVRIRVIEGKVGDLRVEGNRYFSRDLLVAQIQVHPGEILWLPRLEDALSRLNAHPDRKAKLVLTPGSRPETTDLILQVTDRRPVHVSTEVDTLGTNTTGEIRQGLTLTHGNLTGHDDRLGVRGIVTEFSGLWGGSLGYVRPLSHSGWMATLDCSGVKSSVGGDLKDLLARGEAVAISPGLIIPWFRHLSSTTRLAPNAWRSKTEQGGSAGSDRPAGFELEMQTGFDWKRVRTRLDEKSHSKDDLRVVRWGTHLLERDAHGQSFLIQGLRLGIGNLLGGSHPEDPAASRSKAGGSFLRWLVNGLRVQQGPWGTSLVLRGSAQVTTDRLVPAEQLRLGGFDTVRGYPEGEFLADAGYQTTVEFRAPLMRLFVSEGNRTSLFLHLKQSLLLVAFWDFAEGFTRDPASTEDADMRLSGVGCGLRLRPTSESLLHIDFGWAIGDRDSEKDRPRLHLICRIGF